MINIIYGSKGSGKTKIIIEQANQSVADGYADAVFITDTDRYVYDIKRPVRFVNSKEFDICNPLELLGFIGGLLAANNDIKYVYVDGVSRLTCCEIKELSTFFAKLDTLAEKNKVNITLSISLEKEEMPDFIRKFIK